MILTMTRTAPQTRTASLLHLSALFLLMPLAGCFHKAKVAVAVPPPPAPAPIAVSVPPPTHPTEPEPQPEIVTTPPPAPAPVVAPRRAPRRRTPAAPAPQPTQPTVAAAATPPPVDLGQLTTGGEANNAGLRQGAEDLLRAQQRRVAALPTATAAAHNDQVERARLFLRQAEEAWKNLDVDGTRTLATKAKVILDEITQ